MTRLILVCSLLCLMTACGEAPAPEASTPSPLLSADPDRLWVLARASRVGDGRQCKDLYLQPDDPRYQAQVQSCDAWSRNYSDYLRINGFPTIEHLHLQEPVYWQWYVDKRQRISDCKLALGVLPPSATGADRAKLRRQRNACDPYENALNNDDLSPDDLGIRYP